MSNLLSTVLGLVIAFLGLEFLIFIHELGHFIAAKRSGVGVKEFSLGFWKKIFGFKIGETEYNLRLIPLGGYVNIEGLDSEEGAESENSFLKKSKLTRLKIIVAGVVFNLIFAITALTFVNMHGTKQLKPTVNPVKDTPAASVFLAGDEIKSVNGVQVTSWNDVSLQLQKSDGQPITFTVISHGIVKDVVVTPVKREVEDELGGKVQRWVVGIAPAGDIFLAPGQPIDQAFLGSLKMTKDCYVLTYTFIGKLFVKKAKAEKGLGGPVLIISFMTVAAKDGFFTFLYLLAVISLMLAIMNSMPIPILDGGHAMFIGLEAVRGKPLKKTTERFIQTIFFYLLILLMLYTIYLDVGRLTK